MTEADLNDLRTAVANGRDLPRETAYLAVRPARPWNVLAITFTNKAAGELKERLRAMLGIPSAAMSTPPPSTLPACGCCAAMPSASAFPKALRSMIPMTSSV